MAGGFTAVMLRRWLQRLRDGIHRDVRLRVEGVVAWPGPCATRADGRHWSVQLTLQPWQVVGGLSHDAPMPLTQLATDSELQALQQRCPPGTRLQAEVLIRRGSTGAATLLGVRETRAEGHTTTGT